MTAGTTQGTLLRPSISFLVLIKFFLVDESDAAALPSELTRVSFYCLLNVYDTYFELLFHSLGIV